MTYWILVCYVAVISFTFSSCGRTHSPKPLIIALPIRIQSTKMPYPATPEDKEAEESEEVQYREQRVVPRKYKPSKSERRYREPRFTEHQFSEPQFNEPYFIESQFNEPRFTELHSADPHYTELPDTESRYTEPQITEPQLTENDFKKAKFKKARNQNQEKEDDSDDRPRSDFLSWNPNNRMMVLQINDIIGVRHQESDESEENEKGDEPPGLTKPGQHWSYQGSFDFGDARLPSPNTDDDEPRDHSINSSSTKKKKKKKNVQNYSSSSEDTESDVYGTDPVVHFLRNRQKHNGRPFDFTRIPLDEDDEFGNWWRL